MIRVALLSMHTSPLARLGVGDGGGMNVYVKELAERINQQEVRVDIFTGTDGRQPDVIDLKTGLRVHNIDMAHYDATYGPEVRAKHFADAVDVRMDALGGVDLIHAHYWMSGLAGHELKHRRNVPLISTFHTLARVKAAAGYAESTVTRELAEEAVIGCSDAIIANDNTEAAELMRLYDADGDKIHVIPPGVDATQFMPKSKALSRSMVGLPQSRPVMLYVGRIQSIKGADLALSSLVKLRNTHPDALLVFIGGPSGVDGQQTMDDIRDRIFQDNLHNNVLFEEPQSRNLMSSWYNAADVVLVPSRSESFGLVALEATASGVPVVASNVGALPNIITDGYSGFIVPSADTNAMAAAVARIFDDESLALRMGVAGEKRSRSFDWTATANRTYCLYNRVFDAAILAGDQELCASA